MKKILSLLNIFTFSIITTLPVNACNFFDNTSDKVKTKPIYTDYQSFNGTRSTNDAGKDTGVYSAYVLLFSWKKYANVWTSFQEKYQTIKFDDKSIIELNTPTYGGGINNIKSVPDLTLNISEILSSDDENINKQESWNVSFVYDWMWGANIHMYAHLVFCHDDSAIYFKTFLKEYSYNATQGPYFSVIINSFSIKENC